MTALAEKLAEQALSLSSEERAQLVDRLLRSLNAPSSEAIDRLWAEEAERRMDDVESGRVRAIPAEQVMADLRRRLG